MNAPYSKVNSSSYIWLYCRNKVQFEEHGCAVCAQLCPLKDLVNIDKNVDLKLLVHAGVTQQERFSDMDPFIDINGPVLASKCSNMSFVTLLVYQS
jgi:hypothetical protein